MVIKQGDRVQVHDPARTYAGASGMPGNRHGKIGVVVNITDYRVGSDRLYEIKFDDLLLIYSHWASELRKAER